MATHSRVLVVGAGFAGVTLVRALRGKPVEVTLVDRRNYHTFTPLLYQVASALLDPSQVAHPIRGMLRRQANLEVRLAEATGVDLERRVLKTDVAEVPYDFLVLCTGSVNNHFGIAGLEDVAFGLKDLEQAMALRNQVLARFEEAAWTADPDRRRMLLTFAVVGGGPTGVEFSGALSELIRGVLARDFPSVYIRDTRILLVEAGGELLAPFAPRLRESARRALVRRGVEVRLDRQVRAAGDDFVEFAGGERLAAGTVIWTAGVRAADLAATLGVETGRGGTVKVGPTLQLPGRPEVFVIGDLAAVEQNGQQLPQLIPPAMQEARHVAGSIMRMLAGERPEPFRYADPGIMATIGRNAGVAEIGPVRMSGFAGWVLWLGFHLLQIVTFRSKLVVLVNWAWNYLFYDRPVRLLVRATPPGDRASATSQKGAR
jgi:NADH:ubiquinone reductase (H+-translocating)